MNLKIPRLGEVVESETMPTGERVLTVQLLDGEIIKVMDYRSRPNLLHRVGPSIPTEKCFGGEDEHSDSMSS